MSELKEQRDRWQKKYESARAKAKERKPTFTTSSDIERPPLALPRTESASEESERLGLPGDYPFTRGVQPTMYRGRFWTMRQYAGFGGARASNERYKELLAAGQTGLSVAFDLPTQMGLDADDPRALGEVGRVGVSICSIRDMKVLLDQLPLATVSTSMTINSTATTLIALYGSIAEAGGVPLAELQGTVQNDILKEYIARGTYIYPPKPSLRLITDLFAFTAKSMPKWNPISISGYHIREAGSTAAQEIGFTLANGIAYVESARKAGLEVDEFAGRLSFFFNVHNDFFEEIAKFRAARRLWARIMKERFHAKDPRSMMLRFHSQTAGSALTAQQPMNNVVRVALQALASVLGGTQSLHTNSWDEALALPSTSSAKLALRTQQLIAYETSVGDCVDPLGGSYHVEQLTDQLEERAQQYISRIDELGGMIAAIEQGYPQQEVQDAAYRAQRAQEDGEQVVVGVNRFTEKEDPPTGLLKVNPAIEAEQRQRLTELRASRSNDEVRRTLTALARAAQTESENLIPYIFAAVKAEATLGEISGELRRVFGEHHEQLVL